MTEFGTDHLKSIKRYVFELQPRRVYQWYKLSEMKNQFSLHSAPKLYLIQMRICINLKEITFVDML